MNHTCQLVVAAAESTADMPQWMQDVQWRAEEKIEQLSVELEATVMAKEMATTELHKKSTEADRVNDELGMADSKVRVCEQCTPRCPLCCPCCPFISCDALLVLE
jgi:Tfp pilus assembly protein PilP